jgi:hypothetical protein
MSTNRETPIFYRGAFYRSFYALGKAFGISVSKAKHRFNKNIPLDQKSMSKTDAAMIGRKATPWSSTRDYMYFMTRN